MVLSSGEILITMMGKVRNMNHTAATSDWTISLSAFLMRGFQSMTMSR